MLEKFQTSLEDREVSWTRVTPEGIADVVRRIADDPIVGSRLSFDVSFEDLGVRTDPTSEELLEAETGVTDAILGIADYGTVVVPTTEDGSEPISLFPKTHVAVLDRSNIVPDMPTAFDWLADDVAGRGHSAIMVSGPSVTADMGEPIRGVHGPENLHVVIVDTEAT